MSTLNHLEPAPTLDEVWRLFKETDRKFQDTEHLMKELAQETDRKFQETDRKFQDTDRKFQDTDRKFRETERLMKETDKKIGNLGNRLGEFVESMVAPALIELFQMRGIEVYGLSHDISRKSPQLNLATQIDLFAVNGDSCILIEVKSKLSIDDVDEHIERMGKFKPLFPEYADKKAYGAVAAMVMPEDVAKYAYRKGFFVLAQQGKIVAILNDEKFKPLVW